MRAGRPRFRLGLTRSQQGYQRIVGRLAKGLRTCRTIGQVLFDLLTLGRGKLSQDKVAQPGWFGMHKRFGLHGDIFPERSVGLKSASLTPVTNESAGRDETFQNFFPAPARPHAADRNGLEQTVPQSTSPAASPRSWLRTRDLAM
jgi:hypothetical protein